MKRLFVTTLAVLLSLTAFAKPEIEILEDALETQVMVVQLTSGSTGRVLLARCESCELEPFIITSSSTLFVGTERVPMSELARFAESGSTIMLQPGTNVVTRIVVWANE